MLKDGVILNCDGSNNPAITKPGGPSLWLYALLKCSDTLLSRSAYEITIEARFINKVGDYLFIGDTSSSSSDDFTKEFAEPCGYLDLSKCIDNDCVIRQASLFNTQSLNTAVRRTIRQGMSLDEAPYQITEHKYVCQNLRAKQSLYDNERYFGLVTSRISERISSEKRQSFNLTEFENWTNKIASIISNDENSNHPFLGRFAAISKKPHIATPYAIIVDPNPDPASVLEAAGRVKDTESFGLQWQLNTDKDKVVELEFDETVFVFEDNDDENFPFKVKFEIPINEKKNRHN